MTIEEITAFIREKYPTKDLNTEALLVTVFMEGYTTCMQNCVKEAKETLEG